MRSRIIETVSRNGGHLAPSLGVVELTLALLATFNVEHDKLIWDVGHQAYAYKMLTGRAKIFIPCGHLAYFRLSAYGGKPV